MLIDKKGRLFGFINVIDLLILLAVIAVIGFGVYKFVAPKTTQESTATVTLQFYAEEVSDFVSTKVKIGDPTKDDGKNIGLGAVTAVDVGPSQSYTTNAEGQVILTSKEKMNAVTVTTEVPAQMTEYGAVVDGNVYGIGHSLTLRVGEVKIFGRVSNIQVKG